MASPDFDHDFNSRLPNDFLVDPKIEHVLPGRDAAILDAFENDLALVTFDPFAQRHPEVRFELVRLRGRILHTVVSRLAAGSQWCVENIGMPVQVVDGRVRDQLVGKGVRMRIKPADPQLLDSVRRERRLHIDVIQTVLA